MDRVRVVGNAGSGKTTTARALADKLGIAHLELDTVHWLPDWQERDADDFRHIVVDFATTTPRWVIEGNYNSRLGDRIDHLVDTYVWLDLPRWRAASAVLARTVRRWVTREELWGTGNREQIRSLFNPAPAENITLWSLTQHSTYRERYSARASGDRRWIRLRSRRAVARFLETVG